jgi:hypothetical protein
MIYRISKAITATLMPIIKEDRSLFAEGIREASKEESIYKHCWRLLSQTILAQL